MIILRKKRIVLIAICVIISVCFIGVTGDLKKEDTAPTVSLPVSNKVVVLDAGHRKPRPEEQKVQTEFTRMI